MQRGALDRYAGRDRARRAGRATATHAPRRARSTTSSQALGGDARARAREIDLLRFQVEEIDAARLDDPDEDVGARGGGAPARRRGRAPRRRSPTPTRRSKGPRSDAVGDAVAALDGRAPFAGADARGCAGCRASWPTSSRSCATRSSGSTRTRAARDRARAAASSSTSSAASTASTLADVIAYGAESAARLAELERYEERAAAIEAARAEHEAAAPAAADASSAARRRGGRAAGARRSRCTSTSWRCPTRSVDVVVEPGEPTDDGADRVVYLLAPNPGEPPGRWPGPRPAASSPGAMLAMRWCSPRRRRRWCSTRSTPGSAARPASRSAVCCRRSARGTRSSASPTSRRWRRSPAPRSWWRRPWSRRRASAEGGAHGGDRGRRRR